VSWPLRMPPTAAPPPAQTNVSSGRRGDAVCRGRSACLPPLPRLPRQTTFLCVNANTACAVAASRVAHRFCTPRAHHRPIAPTRKRRVSWPLREKPTAASPPAPNNVTLRRRGDAMCRGRFACRSPLPHPARPPSSHRADAETPCVVAAPRDAYRCLTPSAHPLPIAPPADTAAGRRTRKRSVSWPLRVPLTAASPTAPTNVSSRRRGDAVCRGRSATRPPLCTARAHQRPIAPPAAIAADATDVATPCAVFSSTKKTGCYSLPTKRPASALSVADHDDSEVASTSTCHIGYPPTALCRHV